MAGSYTSPEDILQDTLKAVWTADTGSGGLKPTDLTTSNAYVRVWTSEGDADFDRQQHTTNWPKVVVGVDLPNFDHFGKAGYIANVKFAVHFDREASTPVAGNVTERAVMARLYAKFHRVALTSTSSDWSFGACVFLRTFGGPSDGKVSQRIIEARVSIINTSGV